MSKKLLFLITVLSLLANLQLSAQAPNYLWARKGGGNMYERGQGVCTDGAGNVIIVGWGDSPVMHFNTLSTSTGNNRVYITKYDDAGNILWLKTGIGAPGGDNLFGVTTDAADNIIVTGMLCNGMAVFGSDTLRKLPSGAGNNAFIVKYDASGNELWAKSSSGLSVQEGLAVSTDDSNNIFFTGWFAGYPVTFGTTVLNSYGPGENSFLVKYDPSGNVIWAKKSSGPVYSTDARAVATDTHGNPIIAGFFYDSGGPVSTTFDTVTVTGSNSSSLFVTKYSNSGNVLWARSVGGDCATSISGVSTDAADNIYVTGRFGYGTYVSFGSAVTLTNSGTWNLFIAKYDAAGNLLWARSAGSTLDDESNAISTDAAGNSIITGYFTSPSITFGSTVLNNSAGGGSGTADMFVAKYDAAGNALWAKNPYGDHLDQGFSVCTDAAGKAYITGIFTSFNLIFGTDTLSCTSSTGMADVFLVKLDDKLSTGISTNETNADFTMYPNPTNGMFTVSASAKILQADVLNMLGQVIYSEKVNSEKTQIDLSAQVPGIYFIQLLSQKGRSSKKICITR